MDAETAAGLVLVAGLVVFLVGAVRWRPEYQAQPAVALPAMHADPRRWTWIHAWMAAAMFVTPAGLAMAASRARPDDAAAAGWAATVVFTVGAACWVVSLAYRLTVVPWAAARTVAVGRPPELYLATEPWASLLYRAHMLAAYATFAVLGTAVVLDAGLGGLARRRLGVRFRGAARRRWSDRVRRPPALLGAHLPGRRGRRAHRDLSALRSRSISLAHA